MNRMPETYFPQRVNILGVPVHMVTMDQTVALGRRFMAQPGCSQIATVNPEFVISAQRDEAFMAVLRQADLCIPDGIGLVYASRRLGSPLPERVPGSELVYRLAQAAAEDGRRLFLLGAAPGVAEQAAAVFQARFPALVIAGAYAGSPHPDENETIVSLINKSKADLLYVAYGAPNQDKWIARNRDVLSSVRLAMGVGGSLDFVTGHAQRAPQWAQSLNIEWLHRLVKEPWRWRRMLALPRFALAVLFNRQSGSGQ
jgi:N-acetylglucosaminyldiphosphoundecaprenol N-acetyl-beta-D-mannosaminyltransferase